MAHHLKNYKNHDYSKSDRKKACNKMQQILRIKVASKLRIKKD